jgi:hypothetical protein
MKLENLLSPIDLQQFNELVAQSHLAGAGAARLFVESQSLVLIGILSEGKLLTWFASPAHSLIEALVTEKVVLAGLVAAAAVLNETTNSSAQIATDVIAKASKLN